MKKKGILKSITSTLALVALLGTTACSPKPSDAETSVPLEGKFALLEPDEALTTFEFLEGGKMMATVWRDGKIEQMLGKVESLGDRRVMLSGLSGEAPVAATLLADDRRIEIAKDNRVGIFTRVPDVRESDIEGTFIGENEVLRYRVTRRGGKFEDEGIELDPESKTFERWKSVGTYELREGGVFVETVIEDDGESSENRYQVLALSSEGNSIASEFGDLLRERKAAGNEKFEIPDGYTEVKSEE